MKRMLITTLALMLALSLTACGGNGLSQTANSTDTPDNQQNGNSQSIGEAVAPSQSAVAQDNGFDVYLGKYVGSDLDIKTKTSSMVTVEKAGEDYTVTLELVENLAMALSVEPNTYTAKITDIALLDDSENPYLVVDASLTIDGKLMTVSLENRLTNNLIIINGVAAFIKDNPPSQGKLWYTDMAGDYKGSKTIESNATIKADGTIAYTYDSITYTGKLPNVYQYGTVIEMSDAAGKSYTLRIEPSASSAESWYDRFGIVIYHGDELIIGDNLSQ